MVVFLSLVADVVLPFWFSLCLHLNAEKVTAVFLIDDHIISKSTDRGKMPKNWGTSK